MFLELIRKDKRKANEYGYKEWLAYPPIGGWLAKELVTTMKNQPIFLYTRPEQQVEQMRKWNMERGWNLPEAEFEDALNRVPKLMPDMPYNSWGHTPTIGEAPAGRLLVLIPFLRGCGGSGGFSGFERTCKEIWEIGKTPTGKNGEHLDVRYTFWDMEKVWKSGPCPDFMKIKNEAKRYASSRARGTESCGRIANWPEQRLGWHSVDTEAWYYGSQPELNAWKAFNEFVVLCAYAHHPLWAESLLHRKIEERRVADLVYEGTGKFPGTTSNYILGRCFDQIGWGGLL